MLEDDLQSLVAADYLALAALLDTLPAARLRLAGSYLRCAKGGAFARWWPI
jgi:hypothetical protein